LKLTAEQPVGLPPRVPANFDRRVAPHELLEQMDSDCSYDDFRSCLRDLEQVNRWLLGYRPTLTWLDRLPRTSDGPLRILDVGSGGGGLLRQIAGWAQKRGVDVELTGIDLNPYSAAAAAEFSPADCNIAWVTGDALSYRPGKPVDIVTSSLMTHHLENEEVVKLLQWMERTARVGWFLNDLERSERSCRMFAILAKLMGWHRFVVHDGIVSFQRAFREEDWLKLLAAAEVPRDAVTLEHWRPGRLCLGRWTSPPLS
jgi:SAM-dependent methyltransferase